MHFVYFQQLLRLVCRLDEENICKSHDKMPRCDHSDTDDGEKIDSDAEVDGMMDVKELEDYGISSEMSDSSSPDTSSSEY